MVGSSNFTLLIVIQFHGASAWFLCLLMSLSFSLSSLPLALQHRSASRPSSVLPFLSFLRIIFVRPCWKPPIDRKSKGVDLTTV